MNVPRRTFLFSASSNACVLAGRRRLPSKLAFQAALVAQMSNLSLKHGRRIRCAGDQAV